MSASLFPVESAVGSFLLAFPALFSVVNPIGSALIFDELVAGRSPQERHAMAGRVALYCVAILLASLWLGGYILNFFGIGLGALRIAGGLVVAVTAWGLLMQPDLPEQQDGGSAASAGAASGDIAFFPLAMPITTGPGTIAVAVALSSQRPDSEAGLLAFFGGLSVAALCVAFLIWICDRWSGRVTAYLGPSGVRILSRVIAFLLLCIGVQIMVTGVIGVATLIEHRG